MGLRGPRKKPTKLRILESDPKLKYEDRTEVIPPADNLEPPEHLQGPSLEKWNELRGILEPIGLMTEADKDQLVQYCVNWELYLACLAQIRNEGMVKTFTGKVGKDYSQTTPHVVNMHKLHAAMLKTAMQFGLTPSARASLDVSDKAGKADPLSEFMSG